jgi:hypothetical protein
MCQTEVLEINETHFMCDALFGKSYGLEIIKQKGANAPALLGCVHFIVHKYSFIQKILGVSDFPTDNPLMKLLINL